MRRHLSEAETAKSEERKARFRELVKKIAAMTDQERAVISAKMIGVLTCERRQLSPHNCCFIYCQCPTATVVGGFRQWIKQRRAVRKGEHGMMIWVPILKGDKDKPADVSPGAELKHHFIMGTVFDVSQTIEIESGVTV